MKERTEINRILMTYLLIAALVLPAVVQFSHFLQGHQHKLCEEQIVHVHQDEVDCEICHFQQKTFSYSFTAYPDLSEPVTKQEVKSFYTSSFYNFNQTNARLRAPPALS